MVLQILRHTVTNIYDFPFPDVPKRLLRKQSIPVYSSNRYDPDDFKVTMVDDLDLETMGRAKILKQDNRVSFRAQKYWIGTLSEYDHMKWKFQILK